MLGTSVAARPWVRHPAPHRLVEVEGADAVDFLQRLCSQDVAGLAARASAPAAFLDPRGKVVVTGRVGRGPDRVWIETTTPQAQDLLALLERYHFTERIRFGVLDASCGELIGRELPPSLGIGANACLPLDAGGALLSGARHGVAWVRWHAAAAFFATPPWAHLGAPALDDQLAECWHICAGIARVGVDTEAGTLALEADLDDHVSPSKGCYTGQEIVARIHTYGHVNRRLRLLEIDGVAPIAAGTVLLEPDAGDPVGRVMSSVLLPDGRRRAGLGYLPRDFWPPGSRLRLGTREGPLVQVRNFDE